QELPCRALLITFDDGWSDTAEYAQPILDEFSIKALVFVAGKAIGSRHPFWEERIYRLLATDAGGTALLQAALDRAGSEIRILPGTGEAGIRKVIAALGHLDEAARDAVLKELGDPDEGRPAMLDADALAGLAAASHAIGGHGYSHRPLTKVRSLEEELENA